MRGKVKVKVRYFAALRRASGVEEEDLEIDEGTTLEMLLRSIIERRPAISGLSDVALFSVNLEHSEAGQVLQDGDEVGIFPPLSGG